jgi:hypothetical protein
MGFLQRTLLKQLKRKLEDLNPSLTVTVVPDDHNPAMGDMLRTVSRDGTTIDIAEMNLQWFLFDGWEAIPTGVGVAQPATISAPQLYRLLQAAWVLAAGERAGSEEQTETEEVISTSLLDEPNERFHERQLNPTPQENEITADTQRLEKIRDLEAQLALLKGNSEPPERNDSTVRHIATELFSSAREIFNTISQGLKDESAVTEGVELLSNLAVSSPPGDDPFLGIDLFDQVTLYLNLDESTGTLTYQYETSIWEGQDRGFHYSEDFCARIGENALDWQEVNDKSQPLLLVLWLLTHLGLTYELALREFENLEGFSESREKLTKRRDLYERFAHKMLAGSGLSFAKACTYHGVVIPRFY